MLKFLIAISLTSALFSSNVSSSPNAEDYDAIAERIKPIGQVRLSTTVTQSSSDSQNTANGETIYNQYCTACHGIGLAGAPRLGVADDWAHRKTQGNDTLYKHAIEGLNAMPAKGACMSCSDDDIIAAVDYMLDSL